MVDTVEFDIKKLHVYEDTTHYRSVTIDYLISLETAVDLHYQKNYVPEIIITTTQLGGAN